VEQIHAYLQTRFFRDETVLLHWRENSLLPVKIVRVIPRRASFSIKNILNDAHAEDADELYNDVEYQVESKTGGRLEDANGPLHVDGSRLSRTRLHLSKQSVKHLIKQCCVKDTAINAYWLLKESICKEYGLINEPIEAVKKRRSLNNKKVHTLFITNLS
jgi:hypothetical protein